MRSEEGCIAVETLPHFLLSGCNRRKKDHLDRHYLLKENFQRSSESTLTF